MAPAPKKPKKLHQTEGFTVRFSPSEMRAIEAEAKRRGVARATLVSRLAAFVCGPTMDTSMADDIFEFALEGEGEDQ